MKRNWRHPRLHAARLTILRLESEVAFGDFDPRPALARCAQRGRTWGVFRYRLEADVSTGVPVVSIPGRAEVQS